MDNKESALPNSLTSAKPVFSEEQMQNFSENELTRISKLCS